MSVQFAEQSPEFLPSLVVSDGHRTLADALDSIQCPERLTPQIATGLSLANPLVLVTVASYRAAGGTAAIVPSWASMSEADAMIAVAVEPSGFLVAIANLQDARSDESEAGRVAEVLSLRCARRSLLAVRARVQGFAAPQGLV